MSKLLAAFDNLIPAGTPKAAPITFPMLMPPAVVDMIEVHVPPGPNGNMGFAIGAAGQSIIPYNAGMFIVASDDFFQWQLTEGISSGSWQMFGYNTGQYDHTVYIRFLSSLLGSPAAVTSQPLAGILGATDTPVVTDLSTP
jgi:hypothetical protein